MQEIKITCPHCKAGLSVRNSKNEPMKTIVCPNCKSSLRVKFPTPKPAADSEEGATELPKQRRPVQQEDEGHTVIGGNVVNTRFALQYEGKTYPLHDGVNTIGRQSASATASVQIATADRHLSRHHAQIEVVRLPGGVARVKIRNWQNANKTYVNGAELIGEETLILKNGFRIKMGGPEVTFVAITN
ncbi:MAG: FHA domain-containing protein [Prevotella sp.]|nr:FHA domain-containing protein [Prevotella sp.]